MVSKETTPRVDPTVVKHSRLGASASHRWMHCAASVQLIDRLVFEGVIKGSRSTIYAVGGHLAHAVAAQCLENDQDAWEYVGKEWEEDGHKTTFTADNATDTQFYLDALRKLCRPEVKEFVEVDFHCPEIHPDFFGTSDRVGVSDSLIDVWDLKFGIGIPVVATHNTQLMMYAVGAIRHLEARGVRVPERVRLVICQPRAWHPEGPIREWYTTRTELEAWITDEWLPAAKEALTSNNPDYMAGDWCRFCPARLDCPLMKYKRKLIMATNKDKVKLMTDEELASLNADIEHFNYVKTAAADETFARMMMGRKIAGSKLVEGKTDRVWGPGAEADLKAEYGPEAYTQKIKSPAMVGKMPGGAVIVRKYAYKPQGSLTVAPDSDVRTGQQPRSIKEVFGLDKG